MQGVGYATILASPQTSFGVRLSRMGEKWMRDKRTPKDVCGEASNNPWQKKIEQQTTIPPPPPEIKNEAAQKPKRAILSSLIGEEMESLNSPSILS